MNQGVCITVVRIEYKWAGYLKTVWHFVHEILRRAKLNSGFSRLAGMDLLKKRKKKQVY